MTHNLIGEFSLNGKKKDSLINLYVCTVHSESYQRNEIAKIHHSKHIRRNLNSFESKKYLNVTKL